MFLYIYSIACILTRDMLVLLSHKLQVSMRIIHVVSAYIAHKSYDKLDLFISTTGWRNGARIPVRLCLVILHSCNMDHVSKFNQVVPKCSICQELLIYSHHTIAIRNGLTRIVMCMVVKGELLSLLRSKHWCATIFIKSKPCSIRKLRLFQCLRWKARRL